MAKQAIVFDDNDSGFDDEEGHFFHVLAGFSDLIQEYGIEVIMDNVDMPTYEALFNFFVPELEDDYGD